MQRIAAGKTTWLLTAAGLLVTGGILVLRTVDSPSYEPLQPPESVVTEIQAVAPQPEITRSSVRVRRGETFVTALARLGFNAGDAYRISRAIQPVYPIQRVHPGHEIRVRFLDGSPRNLEYDVDRATRVDVRWREDGGIEGLLHRSPYESRLSLVRGRIETSLFAAILEAGEDAALADLLASLFEYDIDFNRDIRDGDSFRLLVEKRFLRGEFAGYGDVYSAEVKNRDREIRILRFKDSLGHVAYYHPDGRSVRKMFLRCPLPFMRVTSRYGRRRHPVLGFSARHNGVDLGAVTGTPVKATATGVVTHAGTHRMKGRYVQLRHPNGYATHYYHLSRFGRGIRRGKRVTQGQVIGSVGSTGMSTGPHLHYGILRNGRFLNPLRLKSPSRKPVPGKEIEVFRNYCQQVFFSMAAFAWFQDGLIGLPEERPPFSVARVPVDSRIPGESWRRESVGDLITRH